MDDSETDEMMRAGFKEMRRERIAVAAMQGLLASGWGEKKIILHHDGKGSTTIIPVQVAAVRIADALIKELDK